MKKRTLQVVESNTIARARIDPATVSVWEERIIALFASYNGMTDEFFQEHTIPISVITDDKELSTVQHNEAKKAIRERLIHQAYVLPQGNRGFTAVTIFDYITIDDAGNIKARFNPSLREHFLGLKKEFAVRSLPEFASLISTYSQQIFRYLNSVKNIPGGYVVVQMDQLHALLSTPVSLRKNFGLFRERILEVAHAEITDPEKTRLWFKWEPIRKGLQKVVAIKFIFASNLETETPEKKALREHGEIQADAQYCWEVIHNIGQKQCRPRKTSPKCKYCTTSGRRWIEKYKKETQMTLPFGSEPEISLPLEFADIKPMEATHVPKPVPVSESPDQNKIRTRKKDKYETWKIMGIPTDLPKEPIPPDAPVKKVEKAFKKAKKALAINTPELNGEVIA